MSAGRHSSEAEEAARSTEAHTVSPSQHVRVDHPEQRPTGSPDRRPGRAFTARNVVLAVLGAGALVLVSAYRGPFEELVRSYGGNLAVSFALYFAAINAASKYRRPRVLAASLTLLAVELFEATNGFGAMANTFDPVDFLANAAGVAVAVVVDIATTPFLRRSSHKAPTA